MHTIKKKTKKTAAVMQNRFVICFFNIHVPAAVNFLNYDSIPTFDHFDHFRLRADSDFLTQRNYSLSLCDYRLPLHRRFRAHILRCRNLFSRTAHIKKSK